jgi:hypothetical protein
MIKYFCLLLLNRGFYFLLLHTAHSWQSHIASFFHKNKIKKEKSSLHKYILYLYIHKCLMVLVLTYSRKHDTNSYLLAHTNSRHSNIDKNDPDWPIERWLISWCLFFPFCSTVCFWRGWRILEGESLSMFLLF